MSADFAPSRGIVNGCLIGVLIWIIIGLIGVASCQVSPLQQVTVTHIVQAGETLETIGKVYADLAIDDPRYLQEFTEGIFEYNFDTLFRPRGGREVRPGDRRSD